MHAAYTTRYGSPDVLSIREIDQPTIGATQVLVQVHASPVTHGDRRVRSADFPGILKPVGLLMMGVFGPRNPVPGSVIAGRVVAVGADVTRFSVGDDVFGGVDHGGHAEYVALHEGAAIARIPEGVSYDAAAATPYGAVTALLFLRGRVHAGDRVLVIGASGGVGRAMVQLARHLGAEVTGVSSARTAALAREAGVERVIDYRSEPVDTWGTYDVVIDSAGVSDFATARRVLAPGGRFVSVHVTLGGVWAMLTGRGYTGVALPDAEVMAEVARLLGEGVFRPAIDRRYPLSDISEAHARLESGARATVLVTMQAEETLRLGARRA